MKRRLALLGVGLLAAGSLQIVVTPAASAASACADPNCPWSPVTTIVREVIEFVDRTCDESTTFGCPL
jgi:hypothetical protein